MPKGIKGSGSKTTVLFNMNMEKNVRDEFHIWCIRNNTTMKSVVEAYILTLIDKQQPSVVVPDPRKPADLKRQDGVEAVAEFFDKVNESTWEDSY